MFDTRKNGFLASQVYTADEHTDTFGIHSSLTDGIPSFRAVFVTTEGPATNGENITDNYSVGFSGTAGAVTANGCIGVTKFGSGNFADLTLLPGFNQDLNVTVTLDRYAILEVAAGEVIALGSVVNVDAEGRAAAAGTASGFIAMTPATGAGTATNPEFIRVLIH